MTQLEEMLDDIRLVVKIDRQQQEERRQRGEVFNVFKLLDITAKETKHSLFIAELLSPDGSHGMGDKFLKAFIESVDCFKNFEINTEAANVKIENPIGFINGECTEGGRTDIFITSENKAIIIENKLDAKDQRNQLLRYKNYADRHFKNDYKLLYLTYDAVEASDYSTDGELHSNIDYFPIGYNNEILKWLDTCAEIAHSQPIVRETIIQFISLINEETNQNMRTMTDESLLEIMTREENVECVSKLMDVDMGNWRHKIVEKYLLPQLRCVAKEIELEFDDSGWLKNTFIFYKENWRDVVIRVRPNVYSNIWKDIYCAVEYREGINPYLQVMKLDCLKDNAGDDWPYGSQYLKKYKHRNWENYVMQYIANGGVAKEIKSIVSAILDEIEEKGLPMP